MAVKHSKFSWTDVDREQFLRIANARLLNIYKFEPQRRAWCANMWARYYKRKEKSANLAQIKNKLKTKKCDISTN